MPAPFDVQPAEIQSGHVLFAMDGTHEGFWGPLTRDVAALLNAYVSDDTATPLSRPDEIGNRFRARHRHGHTGIGALVATALELATWDLLAKRNGVPVWRLVSPAAPEPLPCYATLFGLDHDDVCLVDLVSALDLAGVVKKIAADDETAVDRIGRLSERVAPAAHWALDFRARHPAETCRTLLQAAPANLAWVEEPFRTDELHLLRSLRFRQKLAAGEHCYTAAEFAWLRQHGLTVLQPDFAFCGGVRAYRTILGACPEDRPIHAHGNGIIPVLHLHGLFGRPHVLEWNFRSEPRRQVLWHRKLTPDRAFRLHPPDQPGWLGEMDLDRLLIEDI